MIVGHRTMTEQALLGAGLKLLNAIDRGGASDVLPLPVADGLVCDELAVQFPIAAVGIGVDNRINGDAVSECRLELRSGGVSHEVHVDDAIGSFVDAEDDVLEILGSRATLDLSSLSKLRSLACSPVLEAGSELRFIDFDGSIDEPDGGGLEVMDCPSKLEAESVDPVIGDVQSFSNVVVGQSRLQPVEQPVDLKEAEPLAGEGRVREQVEPNGFRHRLQRQRPSSRRQSFRV